MVAGFEAHRGSGGNVQPHAKGARAFESQAAVHLEEMKMRTDLNGPVADVGDFHFFGPSAGIGHHRIRVRENIHLESYTSFLAPMRR